MHTSVALGYLRTSGPTPSGPPSPSPPGSPMVLVYILGSLTVLGVFVVAAVAVGLEGKD